jgi:SAM-dependent methyltransferase
MKDITGNAIFDHYHKTSRSRLWIHNTYGPREEMPVGVYLRDQGNMPPLELIALQQCKGKVLDIGAGAGSHALLLQARGMDVTALEISPKAAEVMQLRGVRKVIVKDIFRFKGQKFDTLLLLMNGIGLTGTVANLQHFLTHAKSLLNKGGQIVFDSSDVSYLYKGNIPQVGNYYGEILYRYEYKKEMSEWFTWLYIDRKRLKEIAKHEGWITEVISEDEYGQYLAMLVVNE